MKNKSARRVENQRFFIGEMMTCGRCKKTQKSDPNVSSDWTVVELDGVATYYCPDCFGNGRLKNWTTRRGS